MSTNPAIIAVRAPPAEGVPVSLRLEEEGLQALKSLLPRSLEKNASFQGTFIGIPPKNEG